MRSLAPVAPVALVAILAACGGSHSNTTSDGNGTGSDGHGSDGNGGGSDGSGGGATTVAVTLANRPNTAATFTFVVGYQDGSSAWQLAPAPTGDTYTFPISSAVWGFAWTCVSPGGGSLGNLSRREVHEDHFAVAERTSLTLAIPARCSDRNPASVSLSGTITNRVGAVIYAVQYGLRTVLAAGNGNYALETPPGTRDLLLLEVTTAGSGTGGGFTVTGAAPTRDFTVTTATVKGLDATTTLPTQSFAVTAIATGSVTASTSIATANGTIAELVRATGSPYTSVSLDATQMVATDVYDQRISVANAGETAIVTNATTTPDVQTYTAPDPLGGTIATVPTTTPYPEIMSTWTAYPGAIGYTWVATQTPPLSACGTTSPCAITWTADLSPGVASSAYQMPDLAALAGWATTLQLVPGTVVTGFVQAMTSTAGATDFPAGLPAAGTQRVFVQSDYSVTP